MLLNIKLFPPKNPIIPIYDPPVTFKETNKEDYKDKTAPELI